MIKLNYCEGVKGTFTTAKSNMAQFWNYGKQILFAYFLFSLTYYFLLYLYEQNVLTPLWDDFIESNTFYLIAILAEYIFMAVTLFCFMKAILLRHHKERLFKRLKTFILTDLKILLIYLPVLFLTYVSAWIFCYLNDLYEGDFSAFLINYEKIENNLFNLLTSANFSIEATIWFVVLVGGTCIIYAYLNRLSLALVKPLETNRIGSLTESFKITRGNTLIFFLLDLTIISLTVVVYYCLYKVFSLFGIALIGKNTIAGGFVSAGIDLLYVLLSVTLYASLNVYVYRKLNGDSEDKFEADIQ